MATPRVMVRFRNVGNHDAIFLHNELLEAKGKVFWGLWLKQFENDRTIAARLNELGSALTQIYIADTSQKSDPIFYVASVSRTITDNTLVSEELVPSYYREKIGEVPIWFELSSKLIKIDIDSKLPDVLGVPTIYFLEYDKGRVTNIEPQREFDKIRNTKPGYFLHLTDIHLGEDHGFRQPGPRPPRTEINQQLTLAETLKKDLLEVGAAGAISGVIISGDIVTRGGGTDCTGLVIQKYLGAGPLSYFWKTCQKNWMCRPSYFLWFLEIMTSCAKLHLTR